VEGSRSSNASKVVALVSRGGLAKRWTVERLKNATPKSMTMPTARYDLSQCELRSRQMVHLTSAKPLKGASRRICKVRSRDLHENARCSGRNCSPEDVLRLVVVAAQTCIHALFAESNDTAIPLGNASSLGQQSVFHADHSKIP
jgi:hypothetical protein